MTKQCFNILLKILTLLCQSSWDWKNTSSYRGTPHNKEYYIEKNLQIELVVHFYLQEISIHETFIQKAMTVNRLNAKA